jgi:hypothetical protein
MHPFECGSDSLSRRGNPSKGSPNGASQKENLKAHASFLIRKEISEMRTVVGVDI